MKKRIIWLAVVGLVLVLAAGHAMSGSKRTSNQGWLGVAIQSINYELSEAFDLDVKYGVIINDVFDDSPAETADLEEDDVIIALNGEKVTDVDDLTDLLDDTDSGEEITLTIIRDGDEKTVKVELGKRPSRRKLLKRELFRDQNRMTYGFGTRGYIGIKMVDLTDQLGERFGVEDGRGAMITSVEEDSPAEEAGLKAGDIIVELDGDKVADGADVSDIIGEMGDGDLTKVKVVRDGRESELELTVAETKDRGVRRFFGPDISVVVPNHAGRFFHHTDFDWDEFDFDFDFDFDMDHFLHELGDLDDLEEDLKKMQFDLQRDLHSANRDVFRFRFDDDKFQDEMKELKEELKKMKYELQDIREQLD